MSNDRNTTCEARISDHLASREESLSELFARADADDIADEEYDQTLEELDTYALGVSLRQSVRVDISTGGPAEWLEIPVEQGHQDYWAISGTVVYHFADWFDHAEMSVPDDSALYRYAEDVVETMGPNS